MPNIQENYTQNQLNIMSDGTDSVTFDVDLDHYIRLTLLDENGNYNRQFFSNALITGTSDYQIEIYTSADNSNIFVKPNEILDINGVPSGNYILQFDFLRDSTNSDNTLQTGYFIKEISPSRKEVRLLNDTYVIAPDSNRDYIDFDNLEIYQK